MAQQPPPLPPVGQGLLIIEASWSHSDTPHTVGLLWTSDQPEAETSTWQHTTIRQTSMPPAGFENTIPASERPQTHALDRAANWESALWSLGSRIRILVRVPCANKIGRYCLRAHSPAYVGIPWKLHFTLVFLKERTVLRTSGSLENSILLWTSLKSAQPCVRRDPLKTPFYSGPP